MKFKYSITIEIDETKYPKLTKKEIKKEFIDTIDSYVSGQCIKETANYLADTNAERLSKNKSREIEKQIDEFIDTRRKRYKFEMETCGACKHWKQKGVDGWYGMCPILKHDTESDESCGDFEDIEE